MPEFEEDARVSGIDRRSRFSVALKLPEPDASSLDEGARATCNERRSRLSLAAKLHEPDPSWPPEVAVGPRAWCSSEDRGAVHDLDTSYGRQVFGTTAVDSDPIWGASV